MPYCTLQDIRDILPKNITIGDSDTPTVSNYRADSITTSVANKHIYFATQFIDARLSQIYVVPLVKIKKVSVDLIANMLPASTDVMVSDVSSFFVGSAIRIQDDNGHEDAIVGNIPEYVVDGGKTIKNFNHVTLSAPSENAYDSGSHGTVHNMMYPDPVPVMTARLACALMFDKLFVADQAPDVSQYGKTLRNMATRDMNGILGGQVRLLGQEMHSRRFVRHQLFDAVKLAVDGITYDQGMESG